MIPHRAPGTLVVLGAGGQLGQELMRLSGDGWTLTGLTRADVDAHDPRGLDAVLARLTPAVVVNCVAATHVDRCESEPDEARAVNAAFAGAAAEAARACGARFIQISTDYVFGGGGERAPIAETAPVSPLNVYGRTKAEGERLALEAHDDTLVVRVSGLFGRAGASGKGGNFVETMLKLAAERDELRVVDDQIIAPTHAADAARAILHLAEHGEPGVCHAVGEGETSWCGLARATLRLAGLHTPVMAISTDQYPTPARRPAYSVLSTARLQETGFVMPPWRDGLAAYLAARAV